MWLRTSFLLVFGFITGIAVGYVISQSPSPPRSAEVVRQASHSSINVVSTRQAKESNSSDSFGFQDQTRPSPGGDDLVPVILSAVRHRDFFRRRHAIFEVAAKLDVNTIAQAMAHSESFSLQDRSSAQPTILARWLDLDADAAFAWVSALPATEHRRFLFREAFSSLGANDPATALQHLDNLKDTASRDVSSYRHEIFRSWSQSNPAAAFQYALGMPSKRERSSAVESSLATWARQDPRAALVSARQIQDPELKERSFMAVLDPWADSAPADAANEVLALPPGKERTKALIKVIENTSTRDHELTRELIAQVPPGSARDSMLQSLVSNMSYSDPQAASEYLSLLPPSRQHGHFSIARNYAKHDLPAALEWAWQLDSTELRMRSLAQVVTSWAQEEPAAAADYAMKQLPDEPGILRDVFSTWAHNDPHAALARAESLADPKAREAALARCLGVLARTQPEQALQTAERMTGTAREAALKNVAVGWAQKDPAAAATWLLQSQNHAWDAIDTVISTWGRDAPSQAAGFLQQLPEGIRRDSAVLSFARTVTEADPETAVAWAVTVQDPIRRDNAVENIASEWGRHDKEAALAWLKQTTIVSDTVRDALVRRLQQRE